MVTPSSNYFSFLYQLTLYPALEKAGVKGRIMLRNSDIKYIVGED